MINFRITLLVLFISSSFQSCDNEDARNVELLLLDKIWLNQTTQQQFYFYSYDNVEYFWSAIDRNEGGVIILDSPAKGTPKTHLMPNIYSDFREGWMKLYHFKVLDDSLYLQEEEDINADFLRRLHIKAVDDTTIGIFDYNRLILTDENGSTIWISKK